MLTGRFQLAARGEKAPSGVAVEVGFGARSGGRRTMPRRGPSGAAWMPPGEAAVTVRYRDPTQMGKVYLLPAGVDRPIPGLGPDEMGPDALDPALTLEVWRARIRRHPGELKNLLRNQAFVAGIGNAYSDEILHAARLQPFRKRASLAPEEVDDANDALGDIAHGVDRTDHLLFADNNVVEQYSSCAVTPGSTSAGISWFENSPNSERPASVGTDVLSLGDQEILF